MLLQIIAALACFCAAFLQFAAHQDKTIFDNPSRLAARKISAMSFAIAGSYILYTVFYEGQAHVMFCLVTGSLAVSQILFSIETLFPSGQFTIKKKNCGDVEAEHARKTRKHLQPSIEAGRELGEDIKVDAETHHS